MHSYIDSYFDDFYTNGIFTDVSEDEKHHEGHVRSVKVDIYERSSIARGKCIEHHGSSCLICGFNFGDEYGDLGEGFIHVHHLRPLHTIRKDYVVDYKNDLIPVCPNCHAMIHRIPNAENISTEEIKSRLQKAKHTTPKPVALPTELSIGIEARATIKHTDKREEILDSAIVKLPILANVKKGSSVIHKSFGKGTIVKIDEIQKHICVSFAVGEKTYIIDAFDKGFLKLVD